VQLDALEAGGLGAGERAGDVGRVGVDRGEAVDGALVVGRGPGVDRVDLVRPRRDRQIERAADAGGGEVRLQAGDRAVEGRRVAETLREVPDRLARQVSG
jgi:hypothetical protein